MSLIRAAADIPKPRTSANKATACQSLHVIVPVTLIAVYGLLEIAQEVIQQVTQLVAIECHGPTTCFRFHYIRSLLDHVPELLAGNLDGLCLILSLQAIP